MHFFSPSTAHRWYTCAASVRLSQPYAGQQTTSEAAREGRAAHWVLEQYMKTGVMPELGSDTPEELVVTQDMIDGAELFKSVVPERQLQIELPIDCSRIYPGMKGRVDATGLDDDNTICIADYKFGHSPVDAFENLQLLVSAAGFNLDGFETLRFVVVQPRNFETERVSEWRLSVSDYLLKWLPKLSAAAQEAAKADGNLATTGNHCKYCPAAAECPALRQATLDAADVVKGGSTLGLTDGQIAHELKLLLHAQNLLKYRIEGLESQATQALESGRTVYGFELAQRYGHRKWKADPKKVLAAAKLAGVNIAKEPEILTPAQAIKAGLVESVVDRLSETPYLGTKLKPIDTKRMRKVFQK